MAALKSRRFHLRFRRRFYGGLRCKQLAWEEWKRGILNRAVSAPGTEFLGRPRPISHSFMMFPNHFPTLFPCYEFPRGDGDTCWHRLAFHWFLFALFCFLSDLFAFEISFEGR